MTNLSSTTIYILYPRNGFLFQNIKWAFKSGTERWFTDSAQIHWNFQVISKYNGKLFT